MRRLGLALVFVLLGACEDPRALGVEYCGNGLDDDLDGDVDCADESCEDAPECALARPTGPGSFAPLNPGSKLGRVLQGDCSDEADEHRTGALRPDCQLLPDNCGFGQRCLPLSLQGRYLRSRCVRQGCSKLYQACEPRGSKDRCPRHSLCLLAPSVCASGSCCVPLCSLSDPGACGDCRALAGIFDLTKDEHRLHNVGVCLVQPSAR